MFPIQTKRIKKIKNAKTKKKKGKRYNGDYEELFFDDDEI
jgi:hypothetical protein